MTKTNPRIPNSDSIAELASFWDTHDLTDFEDQLEEVPAPVFCRDESEMVSVRLAPGEAEAIQRIAKTRGTDVGILLHDWVSEKLQRLLRAESLREVEQG